MNQPQISWYVVEQNEILIPQEEYYAGSYRPGDSVVINMQVWNNRWGNENAANAVGCKVIVFFDNLEDSALLKFCKITIDGIERYLELLDYKGYIDLGKQLAGINNNGSPLQHKDNYSEIKMEFGPVTNGMKNTLKNMYLDLQFESVEGGDI